MLKGFLSFWFMFTITIATVVFVAYIPAEKDIEALANNMYFEARNSSIEDQIATAIVVMNRGEPRVEVYKKGQFSWTTEFSKPADNDVYKRCKALAKMVYFNKDAFSRKYICKHYTAITETYGGKHWTKSFKKRKQIGKHYYYCN